MDPSIEPINKLIQHPTAPVKAPTNANKSKSPCPMPLFPVK